MRYEVSFVVDGVKVEKVFRSLEPFAQIQVGDWIHPDIGGRTTPLQVERVMHAFGEGLHRLVLHCSVVPVSQTMRPGEGPRADRVGGR